jgi:hypothetical protein
MEIITIENKKYVLGDYVLENAVIYSKGIRSSRELIKKKLIDTKHYIYARNTLSAEERLLRTRNTEDNWIITNGKSVKFDKILLTHDFIKTIDELNNNNLNKIIDINGIEEAPDILELDNNEKFKDDEGNILEIEVRGERKYDKIYFKVKDIMKKFNMKNLYKIIIDVRNSYTENKDYKYFITIEKKKNTKMIALKTLFLTFDGFKKFIEINRSKFSNKLKYTMHKWLEQNFDKNKLINFKINIQNNINKSKIGYTYCITSPNTNYIKIGYWRSSIDSLNQRYITYYGSNLELFYVKTFDAPELEKKCHIYFKNRHIENELYDKKYLEDYKYFLENNKEDIDIELYNDFDDNLEYDSNEENIVNYVPLETIKEVFNADSNTLPCIYLFTLGYAKDLRDSMNINNSIKDDSIIAKFGFTKNLSRRTEEHIKTYGNIPNCDFKLKYYTYIDPQYISTAESDIKELFDSLELKLEYKNYLELVVIPQSLLKIISEKYNHIGKKYAGHISELITKIKELENDKKIKELEFELALQKEQHKNELSTKEIEMLQYKILLLQKS